MKKINKQTIRTINKKTVEYILPQESTSYTKIPTNIIKWQKHISPIEFSFLTYLISRINKHKGYAYFSIKTAEKECNICENTIRKTTKILEKLNIIFVSREYKNNRYFLKTPQEPDKNIIKQFLPKAYEKIVKETREMQKIEENKREQIIYKKISPQNTNEENKDNYRKRKAPHTDEQNMRPKEINKFIKIKSHNYCEYNQYDRKRQEKYVVNEEKKQNYISFLTKQGITLYKAKKLAEQMPALDINKYAKFIYQNTAKNITIRNKPGFIIYTIENGFCEKYIADQEAQQEQKQKQKQKENNKRKVEQIKTKINEYAEELWNNLSNEKQEIIKQETIKENEYLKKVNFKEGTMETFYINFIKERNIPKHIIDIIEDDNANSDYVQILEDFIDTLNINYTYL